MGTKIFCIDYSLGTELSAGTGGDELIVNPAAAAVGSCVTWSARGNP